MLCNGTWQKSPETKSGLGLAPSRFTSLHNIRYGILFVNLKGRRLSTRAIDLVIRQLGHAANLVLSVHVLRHTCLTNLVRRGNDLVLVAEVAGHKRLETTRRYSLPSAQDRENAMEGLRVDY